MNKIKYRLKSIAIIFAISVFNQILLSQDSNDVFLTNEGSIEFTEHLGEYVPGDIELIDENGNSVNIGKFITKPTILMFVYYECPGLCTPLLTEVADVLGKTNLDYDKIPFQLLTVSFDPRDKPEIAAKKRINYLAQVGKPLPPEMWRFFTGTQENINNLTNAVGFSYQRAGLDFTHPGGLILLSPERKIVRYLYGIEFLPFEFKMGIMEAAQGKVSPTTAKLLRYCFSYDPIGRTYVFNIARVVATVMIISVLFFTGFLIFVTRRKRGKE
jgi:protein SCO1/2